MNFGCLGIDWILKRGYCIPELSSTCLCSTFVCHIF